MSKNLNPLLEQWSGLKFWDIYEKRKIKQRILDRQRLSGKQVLPPKELWFRSLEYTDPKTIKCVILGQDPYPTPMVGHGLAFSVMPDVKKIPPSLRNILEEYQEDLVYPKPANGYLKPWADDGVLLLNTCLTVDQGKPGSHCNQFDWELLTYEILRHLSMVERTIAFVFWGRYAEKFVPCITGKHHGVLISGHPSPLGMGAELPFRGSRPFSGVNKVLSSVGQPTVNWRLPG